MAVHPSTFAARDALRVAPALRRPRAAPAGSVTAPRYRPQPLDLAQPFGDAVHLDLGGEGGVTPARLRPNERDPRRRLQQLRGSYGGVFYRAAIRHWGQHSL